MKAPNHIEPEALAALVATLGATITLRGVVIGDLAFEEIEITPAAERLEYSADSLDPSLSCPFNFSAVENFGGVTGPEIHIVNGRRELTDGEAQEFAEAIEEMAKAIKGDKSLEVSVNDLQRYIEDQMEAGLVLSSGWSVGAGGFLEVEIRLREHLTGCASEIHLVGRESDAAEMFDTIERLLAPARYKLEKEKWRKQVAEEEEAKRRADNLRLEREYVLSILARACQLAADSESPQSEAIEFILDEFTADKE